MSSVVNPLEGRLTLQIGQQPSRGSNSLWRVIFFCGGFSGVVKWPRVTKRYLHTLHPAMAHITQSIQEESPSGNRRCVGRAIACDDIKGSFSSPERLERTKSHVFPSPPFVVFFSFLAGELGFKQWVKVFSSRTEGVRFSFSNPHTCGYYVPGSTRLGKMSKSLLPGRFWKPCSGNSGDCHVWQLATDPSPHSADGSPAADISPGGLSAPCLLYTSDAADE